MENRTELEVVEINPQQAATASVIWLHGLGADGHDFANIVPALELPADLAIRFIFPHAPLRSITINSGYVMRAWFDIYAFDMNAPQDHVGIAESHEAIEKLIAKENRRGIPTEKIILAGFSQGGAIALSAGLRYPKRLAGILALSTFLPLADKLASERSKSNQDIPIFLAHGTQDPVLPLQLGEYCKMQLAHFGYNVEWHAYPMQHEVCLPEIKDIAHWLKQQLSPLKMT